MGESLVCDQRGCGKEHRVCMEAPKLPAADAWLVYRCTTTHLPAGVRCGELKWKAVATCPDGAIAIRPPAE